MVFQEDGFGEFAIEWFFAKGQDPVDFRSDQFQRGWEIQDRVSVGAERIGLIFLIDIGLVFEHRGLLTADECVGQK